MPDPHIPIDPDPIDGLPTAIHLRLLQLQRWGCHGELRDFAIGCARATISARPEMLPTLRNIRNAANRDDESALAELHRRLGGHGPSICTLGKRVHPAGVATFFAVFGCTFPDPVEAAARASQSERDFFRFLASGHPPWPSITGDPAAEAEGEAMGRQIDYLDRLLISSRPSRVDSEDPPARP